MDCCHIAVIFNVYVHAKLPYHKIFFNFFIFLFLIYFFTDIFRLSGKTGALLLLLLSRFLIVTPIVTITIRFKQPFFLEAFLTCGRNAAGLLILRQDILKHSVNLAVFCFFYNIFYLLHLIQQFKLNYLKLLLYKAYCSQKKI